MLKMFWQQESYLMTCYIWFEGDSGFKITKLDDDPSWEEIAVSMPEAVNVVELMNKPALEEKASASLISFINRKSFVSIMCINNLKDTI
jgi:hypothetical protein